MRYGGRKIGPRFGQKLGRLGMAAITAGNKGNYEDYRRLVEEIYQMLDTVAEEAGFEQHFKRGNDTVQPTVVAAESKPATKSKSTKSKTPSRTKTTKRPSKDSSSSD